METGFCCPRVSNLCILFGPSFGAVRTQVKAVPQGYGSEAPLIEKEAPDIVDDAAYSIQDDKLKTEDDNRCYTYSNING